MSTPLIDNLWRQIRQKWGNEKNIYSPVNRKPERAVQAKMGFEKEKWKNEVLKKHWPQMRTSNVYPALTRLTTATCIQGLSKGPSSTSFIALSHGFDASPNDGLSKKGFSPVNMLQHEPLRAQSSNISSAFVKLLWLLCQTANQSCIPSIHTCITMHFMCSYIQ